ncbi:MAG: biopolymer transporter ExbD [Candidatus Omnitrophota bacterium]
MRFRKLLLKESNLSQTSIIAFLNIIFLFFAFLILSSGLNVTSGLNVKFPRVLTNNEFDASTLDLVVSGGNTIYIQDKQVELNVLKSFLSGYKYTSILIKADKKASLEVITGIWNVCKDVGIEKIGIVTTYN